MRLRRWKAAMANRFAQSDSKMSNLYVKCRCGAPIIHWRFLLLFCFLRAFSRLFQRFYHIGSLYWPAYVLRMRISASLTHVYMQRIRVHSDTLGFDGYAPSPAAPMHNITRSAPLSKLLRQWPVFSQQHRLIVVDGNNNRKRQLPHFSVSAAAFNIVLLYAHTITVDALRPNASYHSKIQSTNGQSAWRSCCA